VRAKTSLGGRGVPDVAAKADLEAGYAARVGGVAFPMGGTSAAAPLWASLIARLNEKLPKPAGYLNPWVYRMSARRVLQDITRGNNGRLFKAGRGWDPCTGWGTPDGEALLEALKGRT
jgi:kumamolisin